MFEEPWGSYVVQICSLSQSEGKTLLVFCYIAID